MVPQICIAVLAPISMFGTTALSPAMGGLNAFFPEYPTLVKMIFSLPALFVILASLVTSHLSTLISRKNLLLYSLIIYVVAGTIGAFLDNIYAILLSRAVLGLGVGILMPISQSLPIDFFTGQERVRAVQIRNVAQNFGAFCCLLLSGWLASETWRGAFFIYLVGIPIFALVWLGLPEIPTPDKDKDSDSISLFNLPPIIYFLSIYLLIFITIIFAFYGNIAILIQVEGIGTSIIAGYTLAIAALAATIVTFYLGRLRKVFGPYLEVLGWLCIGTSFVIYATADMVLLFYIGGTLSAASLGIITSNLMLKVSAIVNEKESVPAMALVTIALFLGQFISPLVFDSIPLLPDAEGIRGVFLTLSTPSFCIAILLTLGIIIRKMMPAK